MFAANLTPDQALTLPSRAGIYAIVNLSNGHRYVGKAFNIRERVLTHIRDLDAGNERTNADMLLQRVWTRYGRDAFVIRVLEELHNNESETHYDIRPDNLSLAEHFYINERGEYNKDRNIVHRKFQNLIDSRAWRRPIDAATLEALSKAKPRPYLVGKRITWEHAVVVLGFSEGDAKQKARGKSEALAALGNNLSSKRLSQLGTDRAVNEGTRDFRNEN